MNPTAEETALVESQRKVRVPSVEALSEIESSSRLVRAAAGQRVCQLGTNGRRSYSRAVCNLA
jgi:hypothetical protein